MPSASPSIQLGAYSWAFHPAWSALTCASASTGRTTAATRRTGRREAPARTEPTRHKAIPRPTAMVTIIVCTWWPTAMAPSQSA